MDELVTANQVVLYIADLAESMLEMDYNESEDWADEQFEELQTRARRMIRELRTAYGEDGQ